MDNPDITIEEYIQFEAKKAHFEIDFSAIVYKDALTSEPGVSSEPTGEVIETMTEPTMEEYITKTWEGYGSGTAGPKIKEKDHFELKGQFLKELRDNNFSGPDNEDANKHIEKVLEIFDLFHTPNITQDQVMLRAFPMSLTRAASRWLMNEPVGSITTWETLKEIL
nr:hypothetical protein [Tanacetum cinerariifolium]